jgi:hypothetical protein
MENRGPLRELTVDATPDVRRDRELGDRSATHLRLTHDRVLAQPPDHHVVHHVLNSIPLRPYPGCFADGSRMSGK